MGYYKYLKSATIGLGLVGAACFLYVMVAHALNKGSAALTADDWTLAKLVFVQLLGANTLVVGSLRNCRQSITVGAVVLLELALLEWRELDARLPHLPFALLLAGAAGIVQSVAIKYKLHLVS